jgi:hypothetical protein
VRKRHCQLAHESRTIPGTSEYSTLAAPTDEASYANLELREGLRSISANVRSVVHTEAVGVGFFDEVSDKSRIYAVDSKGFVREELVPRQGTPSNKLG